MDGVAGSGSEKTTLRVSLDFDGVIANPHIALCKMAEEKHGITLVEDDIYQWGLEEVLKVMGATDVNFDELFTAAWWKWKEIPYQDPSVPKAITRLVEIADVTIVTGNRSETVAEGKVRWLTRAITRKEIPEGIPVRGMDGDAREKYQLDFDVFIDDCPHIVVGADRLGKHAVVYDRPWNRGVRETRYVMRADNLFQASILVEALDEFGSFLGD